jgi:hypothetical protein
MRVVFGTMAVAIAISLTSISATGAAPFSGAVIADAVKANTLIKEARCWWRCTGHNRWGTCIRRVKVCT